MAETRPEEIVKLLKADPAGERQAILQYLQHAWSMSDEGRAGAEAGKCWGAWPCASSGRRPFALQNKRLREEQG
ncbi:hypothetical protein [Gelria sp. Kuro-4]|uniref:hypothetical protein n=1 Tax=Gelria sp. Kuro-4 TaxID=2796927 RepID=UPI001BF0BBFA|nr:hypothetical protein [Gelria sp. Kuro-4]BCV24397.1 hypothetical protein kuro4_11700 [Gelria sp. Kuro-4]